MMMEDNIILQIKVILVAEKKLIYLMIQYRYYHSYYYELLL